MQSVNPATGEVVQRYEEHGPAEVERRLARAEAGFAGWRATPADRRAAVVGRAGELLLAEKDALGRLITAEMGKPLRQSVAEVEKCASACRYYAERGPSFLADQPVELGGRRAFLRPLPLGPVLAVMPWNFPFWQVFRFAAPALVAGNVGLLKHASSVPGCALAIEDVLRRAGAPDGAFQALLVPSATVEPLLADPRVRAATLTGSEGAGVKVGEAAGRALKKVVLELGGSDPFIVLPSADVDRAAEVAVQARCQNTGQSCIAAKRFIVHEAVADRFEARFAEGLRRLRVGDPLDPATEVGPLVSASGRDELVRQVEDAVRAGARLVCGGKARPEPGYWFEPTLLADVPERAAVFLEEVFGPVALLFRVPGLDEAIALANRTPFGLGSSAWTRDAREAERCATELEAGATFVNAMVASDPRLPFGGVKRSGHGRELGPWGLREFVNLKTVVVD